MIEYKNDAAYIDGYRFMKDKQTGYYLSSNAIKGKRVRLHVYVWEKNNGPIPEGYEIHHKDKNKDNNEIENLEALTSKEHHKLHERKPSKETIRKMQEGAKIWHKSEEGRKWHSKHGHDTWKDKEPIKYICTQCGKEFESLKRYGKRNRFCSNNCKAAFRRASGVDLETRKCEYCGKEFKVNKYAKKRFCELHKHPAHRKGKE